MTLWFLVGLAIAWTVVFLPAMLRARHSAPLSASERFKKGLDLMAPYSSNGRYVMTPSGSARERALRRRLARRRRILEVLISSCAVTFIMAAFVGGVLWRVNATLVLALVVYVVLLLGTKRQRHEQLTKVHSMEDRRRVARRQASDERIIFHEPVRVSGGR